ncbi:MAG: TRZ/ATZ family hydrolase [Candidatus Polarisedimenticolaceae bacterium]|nr:TRZ/ATZ family hydrolase [Candidatus Polarisedimenticolaceae bacterium]
MNIETLIHAEWIIPVVPEGEVLENHAVAIDAGRIVEILPSVDAQAKYTAASSMTLEGHALIPGLINSHTHAAMSLMRGLADDLPLMTWLNEHIWPAEGRFVSEEFVRDGTQLAMAEMLRGGTTCFNDMYFYPDTTARVAAAAGMRVVVGLIVIDFPTAWAADADEYLKKGLDIHDEFRGHPLVTTAFAPHAPYTVSNGPLDRVRTLSDELQTPIHMHLHETKHEVDEATEQQGQRPIERLAELNIFSPNMVAVHMTQLSDDEITLIAETGSHVVHCPESNLKLASGFCPVTKLVEAGVNVALGTDGAASNNDLNMFSEMRTAALLAKGVSGDASALPAEKALSMATINGAKALGIANETGSLEVGKMADMVAVDLNALETRPIYHPISQLVYATDREQVAHVWVAGKQLLRDRNLTTLDSNKIRQRTDEWQKKISEFQ